MQPNTYQQFSDEIDRQRDNVTVPTQEEPSHQFITAKEIKLMILFGVIGMVLISGGLHVWGWWWK